MKGNFTVDHTAIVEIVPADDHRGETVIQHLTGDKVYLEFGPLNEALGEGVPVVGEGLVLSAEFPLIKIRDHRKRLAVNAICATDESATGTYSTDHL